MTSRSGARERWALVLLLLLAAVVRGVRVAERTGAPDYAHPIVDAGFHDHWARSLADADWNAPANLADPGLRTRAYLRPPGYPHFLAGVYALTGGSALAPLVVQALLGLASTLLGAVIARRAFGPWAGIGAAALLGFYWVLVYFEGELHAPALLLFLSLALLHVLSRWLERPGAKWAFAAGLLLGASALVRPNVLVFLPVVLGWGYWTRRAQVASAAALVLGCALAVAPATIRNWIVARDFVPISSNAGINLWIGNHAGATGFVAEEIPGLGTFETCYDYPRLVARLERELGRPLSDSEVSGWFAGEALRWIREHPGDAARLTLKKAGWFFGPIEVLHNKELRAEREHSRVLRHLPGGFGALLALAVIGVVLLARERGAGEPGEPRRAMAVLLLALVLAYFLSVLPFFHAARYRVPVLPFLMLLCALPLARFLALVGTRQWKPAAVGLGVFGALAVLLSLPAFGSAPRMDKWHRDRAHAFLLADDSTAAAVEYRAALAIEPNDAAARYSLGVVLERLGRPAEALEEYATAARLDPGSARVRNNLGNLLARAGRIEEALPHFEAAALADPGYAHAFRNLGTACHALSRLPEALDAYARWAELEPENAAALEALAGVQAQSGDFTKAVATAERALRLLVEGAQERSRLEAARAAYSAGHIPEETRQEISRESSSHSAKTPQPRSFAREKAA